MNIKEILMECEKNMYVSHKIKDKIEILIKNKTNRELTPQRFWVLMNLNDYEKIKLKDISKNIGLSTQTLCMIYNNLEKKNYIKREVDVQDRRNTYYSITEKGREVVQNQIQKINGAMGIILEKMSKKDLDELGISIKIINDIFNKYI